MGSNSIAKFKRYNFSLTEEVSKKIDELSLKPRSFRCSRSEVVKAGIQALANMNEKELLSILQHVHDSK